MVDEAGTAYAAGPTARSQEATTAISGLRRRQAAQPQAVIARFINTRRRAGPSPGLGPARDGHARAAVRPLPVLKSPPCAAPVATGRPLGLDAAGLVDEAGVAEGPRVPLAPRRAIPEVAPRLVAAARLLVVVEIACRSLPATPSPTTVAAPSLPIPLLIRTALAVGSIRFAPTRGVSTPEIIAVLTAPLSRDAAIPKAGFKVFDPLVWRNRTELKVPHTALATKRITEARIEPRRTIVQVRPPAMAGPRVVATSLDAGTVRVLPVIEQQLVGQIAVRRGLGLTNAA